MTTPRPFQKRTTTIVAIMLTSALGCASSARAETQPELEAQVRALVQEVAALKTQVAQLTEQQSQQVTSFSPTPNAYPTSIDSQSAPGERISFNGYGQIDYSRPTDNPSDTTATVSRFVVGMDAQLDELTRLVSEVEIENAVSSSDDPGEVEVEQAYVERTLTERIYGKAGLFLIPSGLLNENHEPVNFYGVFRNRVETQIIPTTWREGGVLVQGTTEFGLRWDGGLTTGFDLSKWDPTSDDGKESPLGSIHQEMALAKASDLAGVVALNYTGIPGLRLGGSVFTGNSSQGQPGFDDNRVTLWEGHATWTPARWEFAALYASGHISNTASVNRTFAGNPTLVPESFYGWYVQAAYHLYERDAYSLRPFVRFERLNTASNYADIAPGLTPQEGPDQDTITAGFSFLFARGAVLKADYQHFHGFGESDLVNLGLGYQF